jgi:hypothetical protein
VRLRKKPEGVSCNKLLSRSPKIHYNSKYKSLAPSPADSIIKSLLSVTTGP